MSLTFERTDPIQKMAWIFVEDTGFTQLLLCDVHALQHRRDAVTVYYIIISSLVQVSIGCSV